MSASPTSTHPPARAGFFAALGLLLLGVAACRSTSPRPAGREVSTLRLENRSDFAWRVELAPDARGVAGIDALRWEIPPRRKQNVTVPAGVYHLSSRLADEANKNAPSASERIHLRAGATHPWMIAGPTP
jgi:hypothetical protein